MTRPLTDRDWDMVTHYAMHGSLRETAKTMNTTAESLRRRIKRIAPQLLGIRCARLGGKALRVATTEYCEKRA